MRNSARILLFAAAGCLNCFGQAKGGGAAGTGTGSTTGTTTPTTPTVVSPTNPQNTNTQTSIPNIPRPMFVSGRVITDDGTPSPQSVTILRVCNGNARAVGYADSKGYFSFDLNHSTSMFQDASTPGGISNDPSRGGSSSDDPFASLSRSTGVRSLDGGDNNMVGCELRAQLSGYRSGAIELGLRRSMDNPDVGVIILHRIGKDEGTTVSMTSMMAPKDAKKAYEKGMELMKKKKSEEAEREFQKATVAYPKYADAWYRLGALQMLQKNAEGARSSFNQAIAADPKLVTPYVEIAIMNAREGKWKESAENAARAIKLDPIDFPMAYYFDALANYNLQNWDAAEKSARQLQKLDSQHRFPLATRILGAVLAEKRDYTGAAQQMRDYLRVAGAAKDADEVRGQLQELEKMNSGAPVPAIAEKIPAEPQP